MSHQTNTEKSTSNQPIMRKCKTLECGKHVYLIINKSTEYVPAFICETNGNTITVAVTDGIMFMNRVGDKLSPVIKVPFNGQEAITSNDEVEIYEKASMEIDTPDGTLIVEDKLDDEYPGVWISVNANQQNTVLSMVEYIPGGEGVCDYNPSNASETERQRNEIPLQRLQTDNHGHINVAAGLVTRAWPCDNENEEFHYRCFHYGY